MLSSQMKGIHYEAQYMQSNSYHLVMGMKNCTPENVFNLEKTIHRMFIERQEKDKKP